MGRAGKALPSGQGPGQCGPQARPPGLQSRPRMGRGRDGVRGTLKGSQHAVAEPWPWGWGGQGLREASRQRRAVSQRCWL